MYPARAAKTMSEHSMKAYEKVLELCEVIIKEDFKPCGLHEELKRQLLDLVLEWEKKCGQPFTKESGAFDAVYRITMEAISLSERFHKGDQKQKCIYLKEKLEKREIQHWFWTFHSCSFQ
jgi:hypothetical protein